MNILDIGANRGDWTRDRRVDYPDAHFHLVEANPACEKFLRKTGETYTIALLGASQRPRVPFYTLEGPATGGSVYRELTQCYRAVEPIWLRQTTLDLLFPTETFDFIKIDTQGSELDILRGGERLVSRASEVLLEVSYEPYNNGAPLEQEVREYMMMIGFPHSVEVVDYPSVRQRDVLFQR